MHESGAHSHENRELSSKKQVRYRLLVNYRAKRISITIKRDGTCIVNVPYRRSRMLQDLLVSKAKAFVAQKSDWIQKHLEKFAKGKAGRETERQDRLSGTPGLDMSDAELKRKTLALVLSRLEHFNKAYSFTYNAVSVKKVKTRWGSCSRKGNLNFSHKLALLRPEEVDYVVVHELCHLGEFNHSPAFWKLVERTVPEYKSIRKGMKTAIF